MSARDALPRTLRRSLTMVRQSVDSLRDRLKTGRWRAGVPTPPERTEKAEEREEPTPPADSEKSESAKKSAPKKATPKNTQPKNTAKAAPDIDPEASKDELYERAKELDIKGRSSMTKPQLIDALRRAVKNTRKRGD